MCLANFSLGWKTHACLVVYLYAIAAFAPLLNILTVKQKYASYESELNQPEVQEIHRYD